MASHHDLADYFGTDIEGAKAHYESYGYSEGRAIDTFDELGYIASYEDLINVFGDDINKLETNGLEHYINYGISENRATSFDVNSYINNNSLNDQFSNDLEAAKKHYIANFLSEI